MFLYCSLIFFLLFTLNNGRVIFWRLNRNFLITIFFFKYFPKIKYNHSFNFLLRNLSCADISIWNALSQSFCGTLNEICSLLHWKHFILFMPIIEHKFIIISDKFSFCPMLCYIHIQFRLFEFYSCPVERILWKFKYM